MRKIQMADALAPLPASFRWREAARTFAPAKLLQLMRAPALAGLSAIVAVLGGSLMSVNASERSVPGDFLYPIKLASEQTRLALTSDKGDRVRLKTEFVDRRVQEMKIIVKAPEKNSERVREAAVNLKRDLDTVKNQLNEVQQESSASKSAELAKMVDEKTVHITEELNAVKGEATLEAKSAVAEAQAQAVQTGVAAMAVLIEANAQDQGTHVTSDAEVTQVLQNKVDGLRASIDDSAERMRSASASGTIEQSATGTTPQIATASSTLSEVKILLDENKLGEATDKLAEAARSTAQAEVATNLFVASSTSAIVPATQVLPADSSTSSLPTPTSNLPTTTSSEPVIPTPR